MYDDNQYDFLKRLISGFMAALLNLHGIQICLSKSRSRKRGWGTWGQDVHILHVDI